MDNHRAIIALQLEDVEIWQDKFTYKYESKHFNFFLNFYKETTLVVLTL